MDAANPSLAPLAPSSNPERTAVALSCADVREVLSQFADGALTPDHARAVEAHVDRCEACARELRALRMEEDLLTEALSDLRPDPSFRAQIARMCGEVHRRAETVANSLPEKGWALFRWALALLAVVHFAAVSAILERPVARPEVDLQAMLEGRHDTYWVNLAIFVLALFLLIGGRLAAALESRVSARLGGRPDDGPSRLEVLTLETLGICGVLATSALHLWNLMEALNRGAPW